MMDEHGQLDFFNIPGQIDVDFNLFIKHVNFVSVIVAEERMLEYPYPLIFSPDEILACIYEWVSRNERWTIGPLDLPAGDPPFRRPSVIRKLSAGWLPLVPTPAPVLVTKAMKLNKKKQKKL